MMPKIAIAPGSKLPDYVESVRQASGDPWVLDRTTDRPADVVRSVDGILLIGGNDVRPALYGEDPDVTFSAAEDGRDEYEIELVNRALEADVPVLAICRGFQLLNVARGGTLIQDIPTQVGTAVNHVLRDPPASIAHEVSLTPHSVLDDLLRSRVGETHVCQVNSRHHQAPKTLGEGLVTTATAPDGVIEAVEDPARRFCLGVQWHPENFWRTGEFAAIFHAFVRAADTRFR